MIEWFKKEKKIFSDGISAITFITIGIFTVINIIASIIPPLNKYFLDNNLYIASGWVVVLLILINLHTVLEFISKLGTCHSYDSSDISEVIYKFKNYKNVKIFFGLDTFHIWETISLKKDLSFNNIELYFDPSTIKKYKKPLFKFKKNKVYFADIPRNYIYISGHNDNCEKCNLIVDGGEYLSIIDLSKKNKDTQIFDNLFRKMTENNKVSINDILKTKTLYFIVNKCRESTSELIREQYLSLSNRDDFLRLASILVKHSTESLYAIDFIGPQYWTNKSDIAYKFGDAHKVKISGDKKRIHIYNFDSFEKKYSTLSKNEIYNLYLNYIDFMEEKGVKLTFLHEDNFDLIKYEKRGSLLIDNKSVIIAINPEDGATFGEVSFKEKDIENYRTRFFDIEEISKTKDFFIKKLKKRYG